MAQVKRVAQAPSTDKDRLVSIEITENARLAVKRGPQTNIEQEETDIM